MEVPLSTKIDNFFTKWNLKNADVAKLVGVNRSNVGRWRKGEAKIPLAAWLLLNIICDKDNDFLIDVMRYKFTDKDEAIIFQKIESYLRNELKIDFPYDELRKPLKKIFETLKKYNLLYRWEEILSKKKSLVIRIINNASLINEFEKTLSDQ